VNDSETQISSLFNGNIATYRSLSFTIAIAAQRSEAQRSAAVMEMPLYTGFFRRSSLNAKVK